jgi:hypothetical protein
VEADLRMTYARRHVIKFSYINSVLGELLCDGKINFNTFTVTPYRL